MGLTCMCSWVAGLLDGPGANRPPFRPSQPVSYLPAQAEQSNGYYPAPTQATQSYFNNGHYGHYPGASQPAYGYGNPATAYSMAGNNINSFGMQRASNTSWPTYPSAAPPMPNLPYRPYPAIPPVQRRSRSPPQNENTSHRRRSPTALNPVARPFAPGAVYRLPVHNYPPAVPFPTHYPTIANHNLTSYNGVMGRRGAWGFGGHLNGVEVPYERRPADARVLAGQQERFSTGSDDVRNSLPSASGASSAQSNEGGENEDGEQEVDGDQGAEEEGEDEEDTDKEQEASENDNDSTEEQEDNEDDEDTASNHQANIPSAIPTIPGLQKRAGKFHRGNYRLACDFCRRRHWKCVRSVPNGACDNCQQARNGPLNCVTTRP